MQFYRILSFNVNGIRAIWKKGFPQWAQESGADIIGLQETKAWLEQLKSVDIPSYHPLMLSHPDKKGYSGVGIYSKPEIKNLQFDVFENQAWNEEGRVILVEYEQFHLYNVYFPNGASRQERLDYKMGFYEAFTQLIAEKIKLGIPVIVMGDVNTAHRPIDLSHPEQNEKTSGFLPIERAWIDRFTALGMVDSFRHFYPHKKDSYTWWDMKTGARSRNIGWRIDYIFVSQDLLPYLKSAFIYTQVLGSDHAPVGIHLDFSRATHSS